MNTEKKTQEIIDYLNNLGLKDEYLHSGINFIFPEDSNNSYEVIPRFTITVYHSELLNNNIDANKINISVTKIDSLGKRQRWEITVSDINELASFLKVSNIALTKEYDNI